MAMLRFVVLSLLVAVSSACVHSRAPAKVEANSLRVPATKDAQNAKPAKLTFSSKEVAIESVLPEPIGSCKLGATIVKPEGVTAPKALIVIVHGSGPMDRNGTIRGGYHPYRDLAEHLATAGYASVRFDKRASIAPCAGKLKESLRADHFLKDVVEVANFTQKQPGFANLPLIILGHSEGVTYGVEIAARGWLKPEALVLMAGLGRYPLDATFLRQLREQMLKPGIPEPTRQQIEALLKQGEEYFMRVREGEARPGDFYVGAYSAFWLDMIQMTDTAALTANRLKMPSLLLQGTRDANVSREDFEALRSALAHVPGAQAEMLDGLDHLFAKEGEVRVAPEALTEIVTWLDGLGAFSLPSPSEGA